MSTTSGLFRFPHPQVLLSGCVFLAALLSYVLPAGEFDRQTDKTTGRVVVIAGTYPWKGYLSWRPPGNDGSPDSYSFPCPERERAGGPHHAGFGSIARPTGFVQTSYGVSLPIRCRPL